MVIIQVKVVQVVLAEQAVLEVLEETVETGVKAVDLVQQVLLDTKVLLDTQVPMETLVMVLEVLAVRQVLVELADLAEEHPLTT